MREFVRAAALTGYFEVMASLGADPRPLLREQGLSADFMINPEHPIPAVAAIRLLERSAETTGCATLGLRMAEGRTLANLGAASLLIAHQPTLRAALEALREFRSRINSTLVLRIEEAGDGAVLREHFALAEPIPARQSQNLALAVLARLCTAALGSGWRPDLVCFAHAAPALPDRALFARTFACPVEFESAFDGVVIAAADLDRPNSAADPQLARHARELLTAVQAPSARGRADEAAELIRALLPSGRATIQVCAASLGLPVRTLQRSLEAEGTSFSQLLEHARRQLAAQHLANPHMRITDIAGLLGYGSTGAFTRWHQSAFGSSPKAARRNVAHA